MPAPKQSSIRASIALVALLAACGGGDSGGPGGSRLRISSINPDTIVVGDPFLDDLTNTLNSQVLVLSGTGFTDETRVYFDGELRPSALYRAGELFMGTEPGDNQGVGTHQVQVSSSGTLDPAAPSHPFVVLPGPQITSLTPTSAPAESPAMEITVRGHNFWPGSPVFLDVGDPVAVTIIDTTELRVTVPPEFLLHSRVAWIRVRASVQAGFPVLPVTPTITAISPDSAEEGSDGFELTVQGSDFVEGAEVRWRGTPLPTVRDGRAQLRATVSSGYLTVERLAGVTVQNPKPSSTFDGGTSNEVTFTVYPRLKIESVDPASVTAGSPGMTLRLLGTRFTADLVATWAGSPRPTVYVSDTELQMEVTAEDLATVGIHLVHLIRPPDATELASGYVNVISP